MLMAGRMHPPFLFCRAKRETGRARSKRKGRLDALRCSGPPRDGGRRIGASADFGPPSGTLGPSAIFLTAVPWREYQPCRGGYRMELLLFSLPLPHPQEGFPKGRNRSFAPLCRFKGVRGEIEIPPRFSLGGRGGHSLFKREYPPGFSVPKRYSSAGNPGIFAPKIPSPYPKWEFPCGSRKIPVLTESPIPSPYHSD